MEGLDELLHTVRLSEAQRRPPESSLTGAAAAGADPGLRVRGKSARGFAFGVHKDRIRAEIEARAGLERS